MINHPEIPVNPLIEITNTELEQSAAFAALTEVRAESVWLANYASLNESVRSSVYE